MSCRRVRGGVAVAFLCVVFVAGCGSSSSTSTASKSNATSSAAASSGSSSTAAATKAPVTLLTVAPLVSGVDIYTGMVQGAQVAAARLNAAGGIDGRKVVIIPCNDMLSTAVDVECAHSALGKSPTAMIGCATTWGASGLQVFAAAKVPSLNCLNTPQDFTNPWSFGINPGSGPGVNASTIRYLCTQSSVHTIEMITYQSPAQETALPAELNPIAAGCHKTMAYTYYPVTAIDMTPFVIKALSEKPNWVIISAAGADAVSIIKSLHTQAFSSDDISIVDTAFTPQVVATLGSILNGVVSMAQFASYGDVSNPEVVTYRNAFAGTGISPNNPIVEWGYQYVMFVDAAAKAIGTSFSPATLGHFMNTTTNFPIPLSRTLVNPGPSGKPQQKEPYGQLLRYDNGVFTPVSGGDNGYFYGF